jgi:hypothetical protein
MMGWDGMEWDGMGWNGMDGNALCYLTVNMNPVVVMNPTALINQESLGKEVRGMNIKGKRNEQLP